MIRFTFFCMAFVALSFIAVPIFTGISKEHDTLITISDTQTSENDNLSFQDIYKIATDSEEFDPASLNSITPAAGNNNADYFSSGFSGREDSALENNERDYAPILIEKILSKSSN